MEITDLKISDSALSRHSLESTLKNEAIALVYQPILSGSECRITGVEALTRVGKGDISSPSTELFISRMEEEGLIASLTSLIIGRIANDLTRNVINPFWKIHINVSPLQILSPSGRDRLEGDLRAFSDIHSHTLALELTENRFRIPRRECGPLGVWMETLKFRSGDLCWFLDDFGRGENFDALDLPVTGLKIDREFSTRGSLRPLKAIARIAAGLGLETIAEGIETREDLHRIRSAGILDFQGYLAWKPLPLEKLKELGVGRK